MGKATNTKIWYAYSDVQSKQINLIIFSKKRGVALSRDSQYFRVPPNISGMGKATNIKFGAHIQRESLKKSPKLFFFRKRGMALLRDFQIF